MDLTLSMLDLDLSPEQVRSARTQVGAPTMRREKALHGVGCVWSLDFF